MEGYEETKYSLNFIESEVMEMLAEIKVDINHDEIQKHINRKIDESISQTMFVWDINRMAKAMCMSKSTLEKEFLHDPRMRLLERQKPNGKRYWFYQQSLEVMKEIMDEW